MENASPLPRLKSLRARGLVATLALLVYLVVSGLYVAAGRAEVRNSVEELELLSRHEKALAVAESAVSGALVDLNVLSDAGEGPPGDAAEMRLYMESCARLFAALEPFDAGYALLERAIARSYAELEGAPVRANWLQLREALKRAVDELEIRHGRLSAQRDELIAGYQRRYDAVTIETLSLATFGLVAFGTGAAWFFSRLARDVGRLEAHAGQIVRGQRGTWMEVRRDDELGRLMQAVNRMSVELDEREKQLLLDGGRRSHEEKMLAVGALAAGVAHEVNNPLAVISGIAQEFRADPSSVPPARLAEGAELILSQAQRAAQAARQLAEVATPQPAELDWVDLNALLRRVVQLLGYDRRYRSLSFALETEPTLPAVRSSASAVQQVLMQMSSLVADALVARHASGAGIDITTAHDSGGNVVVALSFEAVLDFSRGEVQRALLLARATVEPLRARLAFGQADGPRQRIKLVLPVDEGGGED